MSGASTPISAIRGSTAPGTGTAPPAPPVAPSSAAAAVTTSAVAARPPASAEPAPILPAPRRRRAVPAGWKPLRLCLRWVLLRLCGSGRATIAAAPTRGIAAAVMASAAATTSASTGLCRPMAAGSSVGTSGAGEECGSTFCGPDEACCNASCGLCVPYALGQGYCPADVICGPGPGSACYVGPDGDNPCYTGLVCCVSYLLGTCLPPEECFG